MQVAVALLDTHGQPFIGQKLRRAVTLGPGDTQLPFVLSVASTAGEDEGADLRRRLLLSGLSLAMLLMIGAAYGLHRAVSREVMLAQQQSDFVSAISHEFRTPLTSMRHMTELLRSGSIANEERKAQYYAVLGSQTERLHRMVESLLSFGRIEAGAYVWRREEVHISDLLEGVLGEFRNSMPEQERTIECDIAPDLPAIYGDRDALARAVWNLLENACKYSDAGKPVRIFAARSGDAVQLGVEDYGPGVPTGEREVIFQKFVRGSEATRSGVRGVGIGLSLVSKIVDAHGGSVALKTAGGGGSTFTLRLPLHRPD